MIPEREDRQGLTTIVVKEPPWPAWWLAGTGIEDEVEILRTEIRIPGNPVGKPRWSKRDKWKPSEPLERYRRWADKARAIAIQSEDPPRDAIIDVSWLAVFEPGSSIKPAERRRRIGTAHQFKPDRDNIDKALLDALFESDEWIASGSTLKVWGEVPELRVWFTWVPDPSQYETIREASRVLFGVRSAPWTTRGSRESSES